MTEISLNDGDDDANFAPYPEKEARAFLEGLMAYLENTFAHILLADERLSRSWLDKGKAVGYNKK